MPYLILAHDKPGAAGLRAATREAHLAYLEPFRHRILAGGAVLADDGKTPIGSLLILDTDDRSEVEALVAEDPYHTAGLFESTSIAPWRKVIFGGEWQP